MIVVTAGDMAVPKDPFSKTHVVPPRDCRYYKSVGLGFKTPKEAIEGVI